MSKKATKTPPPTESFKMRDPFEGLPYGVNALIRNEGSTIEEVRLSDIDLLDDTWRLRPAQRLDLLAESIEQAGQRTPVVLRYKESSHKWQIVSGFRRLEAIRQLRWPGVEARLFDAMTDDEAVRAAVSDNFFGGDLTGDHLDTFMERLKSDGMLTAAVLEFLDWAREKVARVAPQPVTTTVKAADARAGTAPSLDDASLPELIDRTFLSLSEASQGLERIFLNWSEVSAADRKLLAAECKYIHDLYPFLTR